MRRITRNLALVKRLVLTGLLCCTTLSYADKAIELNSQIEVANSPQPVMRFCYEDKQLLPYFTGNGSALPEQPGATIEHLQRASAQSGIQVLLTRQPWLRCLQQLEANTVDAIVASYDESRAHFTIFPSKLDGQPDPNFSINQLGLCLAFKYDNPLLIANRYKTEAFTVARTLGYKPIPFPEKALMVDANSPEQSLELVVEGRVDATTVLCQFNGIDGAETKLNLLPLKLIYPPIHQSYGYLMLSKKFYQQYPQYAEALWQAIADTQIKSRYIDYLLYPDM